MGLVEHANAPMGVGPAAASVRLYPSFAAATAACATLNGYDSHALAAHVVATARAVLASGGLDSVPDHIAQSVAAVSMARRRGGPVSVLDFGGAVPWAAVECARRGIPVTWHVVELPSFVRAARDLHIPGVTFTAGLPVGEAWDLVHTSGALAYTDAPRRWLRRLLALRGRWFFAGRCALAAGACDVITVQRSRIADHGVRSSDVPAPNAWMEYPVTHAPRDGFLAEVEAAGYRPRAEFASDSGWRAIPGESISGGAFLWERVVAPPS